MDCLQTEQIMSWAISPPVQLPKITLHFVDDPIGNFTLAAALEATPPEGAVAGLPGPDHRFILHAEQPHIPFILIFTTKDYIVPVRILLEGRPGQDEVGVSLLRHHSEWDLLFNDLGRDEPIKAALHCGDEDL